MPSPPGYPVPPGAYQPPPPPGGGYAPPSPYGPPPAPPGQYGYGVPYWGATVTNTQAIWALVVALASMVMCPFGGIIAVILGHSARNQIRASNGRETGDGLALSALVIGWLEVALVVIAIFVIFVLILVGNQTKNVFCNISNGLSTN